MTNATSLARYLVKSYEQFSNSQFESSELKLQKLMYFAQKESLALTGEPIFSEEFKGWRHGPVLQELRFFFEENFRSFDAAIDKVNDTQKFVIDNVINKYAQYEAWALADMSHKETSWIKSRKGLAESESGGNVISIDDIRKDAEKITLYDAIYDMDIEDFEDFKGKTLCL